MTEDARTHRISSAQEGHVPKEARAFQGQVAGVVTRTAAAVVDMLVVVVVLVALWAGLAAVKFMARPARFSLPSPTYAQAVTVGLPIALVYLVVAWSSSGRTLGDQLLGLRVVSRDGDPLSGPGALLRAVLYLVFPIGLFWSAVDRRSRSLQDLVVGSRVIYDWRSYVPNRGPTHP
jgi:uncharacterized RDD family membrane protein YckC